MKKKKNKITCPPRRIISHKTIHDGFIEQGLEIEVLECGSSLEVASNFAFMVYQAVERLISNKHEEQILEKQISVLNKLTHGLASTIQTVVDGLERIQAPIVVLGGTGLNPRMEDSDARMHSDDVILLKQQLSHLQALQKFCHKKMSDHSRLQKLKRVKRVHENTELVRYFVCFANEFLKLQENLYGFRNRKKAEFIALCLNAVMNPVNFDGPMDADYVRKLLKRRGAVVLDFAKNLPREMKQLRTS